MAVVSFPTTLYPLSDAVTRRGTAGAAIAAGEVVCINSSTGKYEPADADAAGKYVAAGIALNSAGASQPVEIALSGRLEGLSGLKPGSVFCLSNVAGDVCTVYSTDLTEDVSYVSVVAIALSATSILLCIVSSGVVLNLV